MMSAPVVPTPEVERKERVEVVPVPPITRGSMMLVVKVGQPAQEVAQQVAGPVGPAHLGKDPQRNGVPGVVPVRREPGRLARDGHGSPAGLEEPG